MRNKTTAVKATHLAEAELRQLNICQGDADLARERYAHALTRAELVKHAAEAAAAKSELAAAKAHEQATAVSESLRAEFAAARERLQKLTAELRRTHNLTEKHAIDGATGAIILPEG